MSHAVPLFGATNRLSSFCVHVRVPACWPRHPEHRPAFNVSSFWFSKSAHHCISFRFIRGGYNLSFRIEDDVFYFSPMIKHECNASINSETNH